MEENVNPVVENTEVLKRGQQTFVKFKVNGQFVENVGRQGLVLTDLEWRALYGRFATDDVSDSRTQYIASMVESLRKSGVVTNIYVIEQVVVEEITNSYFKSTDDIGGITPVTKDDTNIIVDCPVPPAPEPDPIPELPEEPPVEPTDPEVMP